MANLIDTSYFVGDIEIPNTAQDEIKADVTSSIKLYEKEVLMNLLGWSLYKELQTWLTAPQVGDKFDKLVNGEDFTFVLDGNTIEAHWDGLKGENKKSLVAYFIYFMHRNKRKSYMAGTSGEVAPESENSTQASLYNKLVDIWNEFLFMYGSSCYSSYNPAYSQPENVDPSAYNYLLAKKEDFPNWRFTDQGDEINIMGI